MWAPLQVPGALILMAPSDQWIRLSRLNENENLHRALSATDGRDGIRSLPGSPLSRLPGKGRKEDGRKRILRLLPGYTDSVV